MNDNQKRLVDEMLNGRLTKATANRNYKDLTDLLMLANDWQIENETVDSSLNVLRDYMRRQVSTVVQVTWYEADCFLFGGGYNWDMTKFVAQGYRSDIYDIEFFARCHITPDMIELTCG